MTKKPIWIGAAIVVVGGVVAGVALRGVNDESLQVQSAKVDRQKIVQ